MAPTDSKSLRARLMKARADEKEACKNIMYPLPDLRGPGGNAFMMISEAESLMKAAGVSDVQRAEFRREAMSGTYDKVLDTIAEWFTVCVQKNEYVPLHGDIKALIPKGPAEYPDDDGDPDPGLVEALDAYEADTDRQEKMAEIEAKVIADLREQIGLDPEDIVIVQIKRAKKKGGA